MQHRRKPRRPARPALPALRPRGAVRPPPSTLNLSKFCQNFVKISSNFSKIFSFFCVQYNIFQHFSNSTNFCKVLQKILQEFTNNLRISENFAKFCKTSQHHSGLPRRCKGLSLDGRAQCRRNSLSSYRTYRNRFLQNVLLNNLPLPNRYAATQRNNRYGDEQLAPPNSFVYLFLQKALFKNWPILC